jgi:hypothetical protein
MPETCAGVRLLPVSRPSVHDDDGPARARPVGQLLRRIADGVIQRREPERVRAVQRGPHVLNVIRERRLLAEALIEGEQRLSVRGDRGPRTDVMLRQAPTGRQAANAGHRPFLKKRRARVCPTRGSPDS